MKALSASGKMAHGKLRVTIGISADGKQQRKSLYGKTRQEVHNKMTDLLNNLQKALSPILQK